MSVMTPLLMVLLVLLHGQQVSLALLGPYPPDFDIVPPEMYTRGVKQLGRSHRTRALLNKVLSGNATTWLLLGGA